MNQNRRRKKCPSYGVRTVDITRGKNGFGFTISGQAPCILSCIVSGSPAEKAGLRPGDFLIAVNGQNVSKSPHDDVVRLIGNSTGVLKLQIAENYYSDSSDEEFAAVIRPRPKYPHRLKHKQHSSVCRSEKSTRDQRPNTVLVDHGHSCRPGDTGLKHPNPEKAVVPDINKVLNTRSNKALLDVILQRRIRELTNKSPFHGVSLASDLTPLQKQLKIQAHGSRRKEKIPKTQNHGGRLNVPGSGDVFHSIFSEQDSDNLMQPSVCLPTQNEETEEIYPSAILKAVVGYLGTIEMPKEPQLPSSRLQAIRNCIRRLRIEKKVHTLVLLSVLPNCIILTNPHGLTLAEFPAEKVTFSGAYVDDKKFFGLVTSHGVSSDELSEGSQEEPVSVSNSCHVFMVDPKLQPHQQHIKRARAFRINCTMDPTTNKCREFSDSAEPILHAIVGLYRNRLGGNVSASQRSGELDGHLSPQHSNTSSNSSNSDSGIGFRDEGNTSDRVFVVDVENYHQYRTNSLDRAGHPYSLGLSDKPVRKLSLTQEIPSVNSSESHSCENIAPFCKDLQGGFHLNHPSCRGISKMGKLRRDSVSCSAELLDIHSKPSNIRQTIHKYLEVKHEQMYQSFHPRCHETPDGGSTSELTSQRFLKVETVDLGAVSTKEHATVESHSQHTSSLCKSAGSTLSSVITEGRNIENCSAVEGKVYHGREDHTNEADSREVQIKEANDSLNKDTQNSICKSEDLEHHDPNDSGDKVEHGLDNAKKWARTSSLRRHLGRKRSIHRNTHEAGTVSDGELANGKLSASSSMLGLDHISDTASTRGSSCNSERPVDVGRVGSWAAGFDKLLEDPAGLHTFAEFLKKEFSQENITFWVTCEQYRQLSNKDERKQVAQQIYENHLCVGALEPVNIDSYARQVAQEGLSNPTSDLFVPAQKQIFNLMKFDCYQRFLKSQLFKECMKKEMQGQPLPYQGEMEELKVLFGNVKEGPKEKGKGKEKEGKEEGEEKRRKSLLPWYKNKSSKEKDTKTKIDDRLGDIRKSARKKKKEGLLRKDETNSNHSDATGSRSSLAGSDVGGNGLLKQNSASRESLNAADLMGLSGQGSKGGCFLCRVVLPDHSTTVVKVHSGETVDTMLERLLERRGLAYTSADVFVAGSEKPLDPKSEVISLSCKEVRVEQRILFLMDLPNRKIVGVKVKANQTCSEALRPILLKFGYKLEDVVVLVANTEAPLSLSISIGNIDNKRIIIQTRGDYEEWEREKNEAQAAGTVCLRKCHMTRHLNDLTTQLLEDLLKGKCPCKFDELGVADLTTVIKNEVRAAADAKNGLLNLVRRNSLQLERESIVRCRGKSKMMFSNRSSLYETTGLRQITDSEKARFQIPSEAVANTLRGEQPTSDELLEVWNRAQRSRLDDQRGIEINFELPDFLKNSSQNNLDKENCINSTNFMCTGDSSALNGCHQPPKQDADCNHRVVTYRNKDAGHQGLVQCFDHGFGEDSIHPTTQQADEYFAPLPFRPSLGFGEPKQATDVLRELELTRPCKEDLKDMQVPLSLRLHIAQISSRPSSHPPPRFPPRTRPTARSLPFCLEEPVIPQSQTKTQSPHIVDSMENIDFDISMTGKTPSSCLDDSLTPSKLPSPPDVSSTSLHLEEANFSPPSPLENATRNAVYPPSDNPSLTTSSAPHVPLRKLTMEPPPLPPKAKLRGPPPRPPSRQLITANAAFCNGSEDEYQEVTDAASLRLSGVSQSQVVTGAVERNRPQKIGRTEAVLCLENKSTEKFNISFV